MSKNEENYDNTNNIKEPILQKDKTRLTILPIKHNDIWAMYKKHESAIWHAHEVKLKDDLKSWEKLDDNERRFIKFVLAFFASSDLIVAENLSSRFMREVGLVEAQVFYGFQLMMENIHSEVYSNMIETYITDPIEKNDMFHAVEKIPCIKRKALWAYKWIETTDRFAERLVAFAAVEGIFFSGAFCCIYWLNEQGKMPGFGQANDFISRDEGLHTDFACLLYSKLIHRLTQVEIEAIICDAVDIEIEFITEALPCRLIGMNAALMRDYIKYVANRLVKTLGYNDIYPNVKQPFAFMDRLGILNKSNFFEIEPTEYQKSDIETTKDAYADL
jgi:ribonucleotide reductase beta subunit family protein with ferritin-like domain